MEIRIPGRGELQSTVEALAAQAVYWQSRVRTDHGLTSERIADLIESNDRFYTGETNQTFGLKIRFAGQVYDLRAEVEDQNLELAVPGMLSPHPAFAFEYWGHDLDRLKALTVQTGHRTEMAKIDLDQDQRVTSIYTKLGFHHAPYEGTSLALTYENDHLNGWIERIHQSGPEYTNGELTMVPNVMVLDKRPIALSPIRKTRLPRINGELVVPDGVEIAGGVHLPPLRSNPHDLIAKASFVIAAAYHPKEADEQ